MTTPSHRAINLYSRGGEFLRTEFIPREIHVAIYMFGGHFFLPKGDDAAVSATAWNIAVIDAEEPEPIPTPPPPPPAPPPPPPPPLGPGS